MVQVLQNRFVNFKLTRRTVTIIVGVALVVLLGILAFRSLNPDRTPKASVDWSRGGRLGEAVNANPVALAVSPSADRVAAVWSRWIGDSQVLHWAQVSRAGSVLSDHDLTTNLAASRDAQILDAPDGGLYVFFTAFHNPNNERALFLLTVDRNGNPQGAPVALSQNGLELSGLAVVARGDQIQVFWAGDEKEGANLYTRAFDSAGHPLGDTVMLAAGGENPDARVDASGTLHLVWMGPTDNPNAPRPFQYATFAPNTEIRAAQNNVTITNAQGAGSDKIWGPTLGLTNKDVYVLWGVEHHSGNASGLAEAYYVSAPSGSDKFTSATRFDVPASSNLAYAPYEGSINLEQLAPLEPGRLYYNGWTQNIATPKETLDELPVVLSLNIQRGFNPVRKIGIIIFADGKPKGYAVVGETDQGVAWPSIAADAHGELFVTWFDQSATGSRNVTAYFAATTPEAKARLDQFTVEDAILTVVNTIWGMANGLALAPLALAWILPGLLWVAIFTVVRVDGDLKFWPDRIGLLIALGLYSAFKLAFLPATFTYIPFSTWAPVMPTQLALVLRVATPIVIFVFAVGAAYYLIARTNDKQLLWMYIFFVVADSVPTMLLYGPGAFGH